LYRCKITAETSDEGGQRALRSPIHPSRQLVAPFLAQKRRKLGCQLGCKVEFRHVLPKAFDPSFRLFIGRPWSLEQYPSYLPR